MTDNEFIEVYKFVDDRAARYKKRDSADWLDLTCLLFKKINKAMEFDRAKNRVLNIIRAWHKRKKADEYYEPGDWFEVGKDGKYIEIGVSENNRIHTAYGKDISITCIGCGRKYIKTGKRQKFCDSRCKKRHYRKNKL